MLNHSILLYQYNANLWGFVKLLPVVTPDTQFSPASCYTATYHCFVSERHIMKIMLMALTAILAAALLAACAAAALPGSSPAPAITAAVSSPAVSASEPAAPAVAETSPANAKKRLDAEKGIVLLDVRTADEYAGGHIDGSVLLPLDSIDEEAATKIANKDTVVFVYCRTGVRSAEAVRLLMGMGYTQVFSIAGGITAWPYGVVK
jgi:phage shock protein E